MMVMQLENYFWRKFKTYRLGEVRTGLGDTLYLTHGHMDQNSRIYGGCRDVYFLGCHPVCIKADLRKAGKQLKKGYRE